MMDYVSHRYCTNCKTWVLAELKLMYHEYGEEREYEYVCPSCNSAYTISKNEYDEDMAETRKIYGGINVKS